MVIVRNLLSIVSALLVATLSSVAQESPSIVTQLDSSMVVVGEQTHLTVWVENLPLFDWPPEPKMAPLAMRRDVARRYNLNGRFREGYRYYISAFEPGIYTIPAFEIPSESGLIRSKAHTLRVLPKSALKTEGIKIDGDVVPYLTGVFIAKTNPYLGETQDVEAKLYLSQKPPHRLRLSEGNIIDFPKEGLAAWRFTTRSDPTGFLDYEGQRFAVYTYRSSINALRDGPLILGPGKATPILQRSQMTRFGLSTQSFATEINFPATKLNVRPLPANPPPGFEGAVGSFTLSVTPLSFSIEIDSSLTVESTVTGTGNIDQISSPRLLDPHQQWKEFETVAKASGSERRSSSGSASFSHVLRPLEKVSALPLYRFVYFDPLLESYQTLESPTIPITVTGEPVSSSESTVSISFLDPEKRPLKTFAPRPFALIWGWHLLPAAVVMMIAGGEIRRRLQARQVSSVPLQEFENDLQRVIEKSQDRASFYREASRFATDYRASNGFEEIFETRDEICFRPDAPIEPLEPSEKKRILKLLRTLAPLLIFGLLFLAQLQPASAYSSDPAKAKLEILAEMESAPAREHFHNLAVCEKQLENNGQAALWAYRYQAQGGNAAPLLETLPGSRAKSPEGTEWVSIIPKWIYQQLTFAGIWSTLILILTGIFVVGKFRRPLLLMSSLVASIALLGGIFGWWLYPRSVSFEPLHQLSVITASTPILSEPFEGSSEKREDAIGSLCRVNSARAGWLNLTLPSGLSGWLRKEKVEAITAPVE